MKIVLSYDIPYAGGYSTDRSVVYIDRGIPEYFISYDGVKHDLRSHLIEHERAEVYYLTQFPTFNEAHQAAVEDDLLRLDIADDRCEVRPKVASRTEAAIRRERVGAVGEPGAGDVPAHRVVVHAAAVIALSRA